MFQSQFLFYINIDMDIISLYQIFLQHPSIQTDSRKVQKGDLFFALKGPNFNGNLFAKKALSDGAAFAIVDERQEDDEKIILVENVLQTLQDLAKHHREQFNIPFIGITGSNGKTTTKELIHAVLSQQFKTYTTEGNLNNHIGIPLTVLKIKKDAEIAVIEMGANHQKEIAGYCIYAQPTYGVITNCGKAHLEGFGSEEGIRKGKGELYDYLRNNNGGVFAFDDYAYLHEMSKGIHEIVWYGTENGDTIGIASESNPFLQVKMEKGFAEGIIKTQLVGAYNLPNVLCAIAIGKYFKVAADNIKAAIQAYTPANSRSQLMKLDTNEIILDAYNANPSSMKVAIENIAEMKVTNKVLILGGMKELGHESEVEHEKLISLIDEFPWHSVLLVGKEFELLHKQYNWLPSSEEAKLWFQNQHFKNSTILIKGSRGIALEKVLS